MEVSIALPTFLLDKEHHNTILIIYLIAMVVIIPCESTQGNIYISCRPGSKVEGFHYGYLAVYYVIVVPSRHV